LILTVLLITFIGGLNQELNPSYDARGTREKGSYRVEGNGGILYTLRNGVPSYTHYNSRGDVTAKTDDTSKVTYQALYEAYGKRTVETGSTLDRQKANTKDEDPTGLLNEGMRYRDLDTGVFLTRDPLGFKAGPNLYTYVNQNPWTHFDPEGLEPEEIPQDIFNFGKAIVEGAIDAAKYEAKNAPAQIAAAKQAGENLVKTIDKGAEDLAKVTEKALSNIEKAGEAGAKDAQAAKSASGDKGASTNGGSPGEKTAQQTSTESGKQSSTQEHHSDPKFMGGDKDQPTTKMSTSEHQELHSDLNKFLKNVTDKNGNDMSPRKGNSGADIRQNFTRDERVDAMRDFYNQNESKYPQAAKDFHAQHPATPPPPPPPVMQENSN
jgi:RHS repeat-associated protein